MVLTWQLYLTAKKENSALTLSEIRRLIIPAALTKELNTLTEKFAMRLINSILKRNTRKDTTQISSPYFQTQRQ
jgi:hypothetical protein